MRYIKDYNKIKNKNYHNLTYRQAYDLELECYLRISGKKNFPNLLDYDSKKMIFVLEDAGTDLRSYLKKRKRFLKGSITDFKKIDFKIENLNDQVDNIIETLRSNNISHLDCFKLGKNICYKNGNITLIDFNVAVLDENPLTNSLSNLYNSYILNGSYNWLNMYFKKGLKKLIVQ